MLKTRWISSNSVQARGHPNQMRRWGYLWENSQRKEGPLWSLGDSGSQEHLLCYSSSRLCQLPFSWIWSAYVSPAGKLALICDSVLKSPGSLAPINLAGELTESDLWIQCWGHLWGSARQPAGLRTFLPSGHRTEYLPLNYPVLIAFVVLGLYSCGHCLQTNVN